MAARLFSQTTPAITPDGRRTNKKSLVPSPVHLPNPTDQYARYRKAIFPSYDRLRFVRLPASRLPEGIMDDSGPVNNYAGTGTGTGNNVSANVPSNNIKLEWWPALIYQNIGELVRDLPPNCKLDKAKLVIEQRKNKNLSQVVVARLIGWRNLAMGGLDGSPVIGAATTAAANANGKNFHGKGKVNGNVKNKVAPIFFEEKLELIRLEGSTIDEHEDDYSLCNGNNGSGGKKPQLLSFLDYQADLEEVCDAMLRKFHSSKDKNNMMFHYALQFRKAFDMAVNCIAMDVGGEEDLVPVRSAFVPSGSNKVNVEDKAEANTRQPAVGEKLQKRGTEQKDTAEPQAAQNKEKSQTSYRLQRERENDAAARKESAKAKAEPKKTQPTSSKLKSQFSKDSAPDSKTQPATKPSTSMPSSQNNANLSWAEMWNAMLASGWGWRAGSGLIDFYYMRPGLSCLRDGVEGKDYFTNEADVQDHAREHLGWDQGNVGKNGDKNKRKRTNRSDSGPSQAVKTEQLTKAAGKKDEEKKEVPKPSRVSMSTRKEKNSDVNYNTYARSFPPTKRLFEEEHDALTVDSKEVVPPIPGKQIQPNDSWKIVWQKMRKSGWDWRAGSGLMMDYYYVKPGCKVKNGKVGRDFYEKLEDVQLFAKRNYGWIGESSDQSDSSGEPESSQPKMSGVKKRSISEVESAVKVKQQKRSKIDRVATPSKRATAAKDTDAYRWEILWPSLKDAGWKVISARKYNNLHDWYYLRPNRHPDDSSSKPGLDYFLSTEDVINHVKEANGEANQEERQSELRESGRKKTHVKKSNPLTQKKMISSNLTCPRTPEGCKTKPQDPAAPLPTPPATGSPASAASCYEWCNLWPRLQKYGWTVIKATKYNRLHDWYYVRPGHNPGDPSAVLGEHYFSSQTDVIQYAKEVDESDSRSR